MAAGTDCNTLGFSRKSVLKERHAWPSLVSEGIGKIRHKPLQSSDNLS